MKFDISLIPGDVQHAAGKFARLTEELKAALQSNAAIVVTDLLAKYYPGIGALESEVVALCDAAIATCQKIQAEDWTGVTARLQRLVADCSHVMTGKEHGISKCISWVEVVIRDILDKGK